jgi:hypothetical protein
MRQPTTNIVSGRQLRAARVLTGLTQAQLAQQAGFHERAWHGASRVPGVGSRNTATPLRPSAASIFENEGYRVVVL